MVREQYSLYHFAREGVLGSRRTYCQLQRIDALKKGSYGVLLWRCLNLLMVHLTKSSSDTCIVHGW